MKKVAAILSLVMISLSAKAGNFSVSNDGSKMIICQMDSITKKNVASALGLAPGDTLDSSILMGMPILKNAIPGTKVLVDGDPVSEAIPGLTKNGYQGFFIPQDQYSMTLLRPDGSKLNFDILVYHGTSCVLDYNELKSALGN